MGVSMNNPERYPDFFIIGAAKAGSTALWQALRHHPSLHFASIKEPNYFAYKDGGDNFVCPSAKALRKHWITNRHAYLRSNSVFPAGAKVGEASVSYLALPAVAREIATVAPRAKMIAILRNPVDRAFSHFLFYRQMGWEPIEEFDLALNAASERIAGGWRHTYDYLASGMYGRQLEEWHRVFRRDQILIVFYEDWVQQPLETLRAICQYLDVEYHDLPITRHNITVGIWSPGLQRLLTSNNYAVRMGSKLLPSVARNKFGSLIQRINKRPKPALSVSMRARLIDHFFEDVRRLEVITGRQLSSWTDISRQEPA